MGSGFYTLTELAFKFKYHYERIISNHLHRKTHIYIFAIKARYTFLCLTFINQKCFMATYSFYKLVGNDISTLRCLEYFYRIASLIVSIE